MVPLKNPARRSLPHGSQESLCNGVQGCAGFLGGLTAPLYSGPPKKSLNTEASPITSSTARQRSGGPRPLSVLALSAPPYRGFIGACPSNNEIPTFCTMPCKPELH